MGTDQSHARDNDHSLSDLSMIKIPPSSGIFNRDYMEIPQALAYGMKESHVVDINLERGFKLCYQYD